jgi:hypothetical protein
MLFDESFFHQVYGYDKQDWSHYENPSQAPEKRHFKAVEGYCSGQCYGVCERKKKLCHCLQDLRQLGYGEEGSA